MKFDLKAILDSALFLYILIIAAMILIVVLTGSFFAAAVLGIPCLIATYRVTSKRNPPQQ